MVPKRYRRRPTRHAPTAALAALAVVTALVAGGCSQDSAPPHDEPNPPDVPEETIYRIPVVVHVIHRGEAIGEGTNLARSRVEGQIRILNEDYRRKPGTRGFNNHPDGGDARIEFELASTAPDGSPTDGIVRINADAVNNPVDQANLFDYYAYFSYWNPEHYLNIWTMPLPDGATDVVLGLATGPETDLPGADLFTPGEPLQSEGILINSAHFGESDVDSEFALGRTLTHEVGHYLGVLHTWGGGDCTNNDFCDDTPAVSSAVRGCPAEGTIGCGGEPIMVGNYMNYTVDRCMNVFSRDQIARMHYVLNTSPRRLSLLSSPGLSPPSAPIVVLE